MIKIYDKDGTFGYHIGTCENGVVYRDGKYPKEQIGSYGNGDVYSGVGASKKRIGGYDRDGGIYEQGFFDKSVAELKNGDVIYHDFFNKKVGEAINDIGAVAAAYLLFPNCYCKEEFDREIGVDSGSQSGVSGKSEDCSFIKVICALIARSAVILWKLIRAVILALPVLTALVLYSAASLTPTGLVLILLPNAAVTVFNFILLKKCKDRKAVKWMINIVMILIYLCLMLSANYAVAFFAPILLLLVQIGILIMLKKNEKVQHRDKTTINE